MTPGDRDRDSRIRHLPPADGVPARLTSPDAAPPPRRRMLALSGVGVTFLLILVVFGLDGRQAEETTATTIPDLVGDPEVGLTTTTASLPPRLSELLGNDVESLRLATVTSDDATEVLLWHADATSPRHYPVAQRPLTARFDASAKFVAYEEDGQVYVQQAGHRLELPLVESARGFAWHPTDEARMAFAITGPIGTDILEGMANPMRTTASIVASVPGVVRLVSWGDWGYAVAFDADSDLGAGVPGVLVIDPAGLPLRVTGGEVLEAAGGAILVLGPDTSTAAAWTERLTASGIAAEVVDAPVGLHLLDPDLVSREVFTSSSSGTLDVLVDGSGDRIAVSPAGPDGAPVPTTTITVVDFAGRVPRVIAFNEPVLAIDFVRGGRALAVQSTATGELLIVDASTGATVRLPVPRNVTIVDASL